MSSYVLDLLRPLATPFLFLARPWRLPPIVVNLSPNLHPTIVLDWNRPKTVKVKRLSETAIVPAYGSGDAAGMDLHADIPEPIALYSGQRLLVKTGIGMAIPKGYYGQIEGRSGLANKNGIAVLGGVIDSDYRGDIGVILLNTDKKWLTINPGDRIAQLVIKPVLRPDPEEVAELDDTARGEGGFGSTGVAA
jgi:dUTP pyrophosphatase